MRRLRRKYGERAAQRVVRRRCGRRRASETMTEQRQNFEAARQSKDYTPESRVGRLTAICDATRVGDVASLHQNN